MESESLKGLSIDEYCDLLDELAKLEHEQWSHWILHQHSLRRNMANYAYAQKWKRWLKLAQTPYEKLTEDEKRSDREWARKVLNLFPKLCPMLEELREMLQCRKCRYYKRCLKKMEK